VNYSDDELTMLPYYTYLLMADAGRKAKADGNRHGNDQSDPWADGGAAVLCSIARTWSEGVGAQRSAMWATIHAAVVRSLLEGDTQGIRGSGDDIADMWLACGGGGAHDVEQAIRDQIDADIEDIAWSLQQWPLELIEWPSRNSQRRDVAIAHDVGRFDEAMATRVLPANERSQPRWNGDPFTLDSWSGGGTAEVDPGPWLLAYWCARWNNLV
jgi:hypothetical protein